MFKNVRGIFHFLFHFIYLFTHCNIHCNKITVTRLQWQFVAVVAEGSELHNPDALNIRGRTLLKKFNKVLKN